jgi:hypothetical protein
MSLVSFEESDNNDGKYYDEEELTKILAVNDQNKAKNVFKDKIDSRPQEQKEELEETELLFDKEIIEYIESLKDKLEIEENLDAQEFINRIQNEIYNPELSPKQRLALEELKKGLLQDIGQYPLQLEAEGEYDYFEDSEDDIEFTPAEQQYLMYQHLQQNPNLNVQAYDQLQILTK